MFIRRSFDEFLKLESDTPPASEAARDGVIDWRWLCDIEGDAATFPSERSLIGCGTWAKPKRRKPA